MIMPPAYFVKFRIGKYFFAKHNPDCQPKYKYCIGKSEKLHYKIIFNFIKLDKSK